MDRAATSFEVRLRYAAKRQGYRLVRRMRAADRGDAWVGICAGPKVPRYWVVRSDGSKIGGPAGFTAAEAAAYLRIPSR